MRFKFFTLATFLFFHTLIGKAETDNGWSLNLQFENNEMLNFEITDQLILTVSDSKLIISQDSSESGLSYLISDLKGMRYVNSKKPSSVNEILDSPTVRLRKNSIEISTPDNPGKVKIYDMKGNVTYASSFSNSLHIDLSTYSKGIYILHLNDSSSIKFIIK